jgi:hypothetical protein
MSVTRPAVILQHTSAPVDFDPPPADPREQPVSPLKAALTGTADPETCSACGLANRLHLGTAGTFLGCDVAKFMRLGERRPTNPERWNDPWPAVTAAVRAAMVSGGCGPRLEIEMAGYTNDEQLTMASAIVRVAIAAYRAERAK